MPHRVFFKGPHKSVGDFCGYNFVCRGEVRDRPELLHTGRSWGLWDHGDKPSEPLVRNWVGST